MLGSCHSFGLVLADGTGLLAIAELATIIILVPTALLGVGLFILWILVSRRAQRSLSTGWIFARGILGKIGAILIGVAILFATMVVTDMNRSGPPSRWDPPIGIMSMALALAIVAAQSMLAGRHYREAPAESVGARILKWIEYVLGGLVGALALLSLLAALLMAAFPTR